MESEEEMSVDLKHDIQLGFNLFKNEKNQINKLKLRTLLFSFVMYKSSSGDINQFIEEQTSPDKEFFTFDEVCKLVNFKIKVAKDKEADEQGDESYKPGNRVGKVEVPQFFFQGESRV